MTSRCSDETPGARLMLSDGDLAAYAAELLRAVLPDSMGATPDLAWPDGFPNPDPWEAWQAEAAPVVDALAGLAQRLRGAESVFDAPAFKCRICGGAFVDRSGIRTQHHMGVHQAMGQMPEAGEPRD